MRISGRFLSLIVLGASFAFAFPATTFAEGAATKAASPKPVSERKVWTNEDLAALAAAFRETSRTKPSAATSAGPSTSAVSTARASVSRARIAPGQDPRWYAQQLGSLEGELAGIEGREQQLRQFRATSAGLPTGLVLNAPCEGITTDNLIAQLEARRQEILQQVDGLADTARINDLLPGILVAGRGRMEIETLPTAEERRSAVVQGIRERTDELTQVRATTASMREQAAGRGITLLQPVAGAGGNMTTDLLDRLNSRAASLQSEISAAEDEARGAGLSPGELR